MKKNTKTQMELLEELNALKQEYTVLKDIYDKNFTNSAQKYETDNSGFSPGPALDGREGQISQKDERIIRQLFDDYIKMYAMRNDKLTNCFSENFSGFTGGGDFLVKDREEWVKITRMDFAQIKDPINIELKDVSTQSLSDSIAVTTAFFTIHLPKIEHDLSHRTARLVLIFRKESNSWKISHSSISIPYGVTYEGEVYPMQDLVGRNRYLEELVALKTLQLSEANNKLQKSNEELAGKIEELIHVREALQQTSQKWEAIISASPDGIGMMSLDGKLQLMSDKLVELFGYSKEQKDEYLGKNSIEFIDPIDQERLKNNIRKLLEGKGDKKVTEYLAVRKDNSRFYIEVNSTILLDSNGQPASILFAERDITERKRAELIIQKQNEHLKELNSAKDKFFSIIAHDLKSPFQSLLGSSELLSKEIGSLSQQEIIIFGRGLYSGLKNLYDLLENLLNWSMMQRNVIEFNPVLINLNDIITDVAEILQQNILKKTISLTITIDPGLFVYADADMLRSVIQNLLGNAIKFTPAEGQIIISSIRQGDIVEVCIQDSGVGIEQEKLSKLFDFNALFSTLGTAGEKGTGLGLHLCKEFILRNSGKIWAESETGKGSKFRFTLPGRGS